MSEQQIVEETVTTLEEAQAAVQSKGMFFWALADRMGSNTQRVSNIVRGKADPRLSEVEGLIEAVNAELADPTPRRGLKGPSFRVHVTEQAKDILEEVSRQTGRPQMELASEAIANLVDAL